MFRIKRGMGADFLGSGEIVEFIDMGTVHFEKFGNKYVPVGWGYFRVLDEERLIQPTQAKAAIGFHAFLQSFNDMTPLTSAAREVLNSVSL